MVGMASCTKPSESQGLSRNVMLGPCAAKFFKFADIDTAARRKAQRRTPQVISPMAPEAVQRIDALFDIECGINGLLAEQRRAVRRERSAPLVAALETWMREERRKLSRHSDVAGAIDYMLERWTSSPTSSNTAASA